jgi:uncharacterized membrane protein
MVKEKVTKINKDNPWRSISKAISWRILASGATFLISYIIFKQYTDKTDNEILETASVITSVDVVAKLVLYYLHERIWTNITWGKYWERRARRKHIKKMRKAIQKEQ